MSADSKGRDLFIVDNSVSGWTGLRYLEDKFHAKAYITHAKLEVVGSQALVGSSNFAAPGLTKHIKNTCLKRIDAPVGGKPALRRWMELNE